MSEESTPRLTILIVDDSPLALRVVKHALTQMGTCLVLSASGAAQAREQLERGQVDLIILDIEMPETSGLEFGRWVRSVPNLENIPIIFFSADGEASTVREAARIGNVDYLLKPLKPSLLREKVRKLVRTEPEASAPAVEDQAVEDQAVDDQAVVDDHGDSDSDDGEGDVSRTPEETSQS